MRCIRTRCVGIVALLLTNHSVVASEKPEPPAATAAALRLSIKQNQDSDFIIDGSLSQPVPIPDINDFRLERIGTGDVQRVPMLFGNRHSLVWPKSATCSRLELTLAPVRSGERAERAWEMKEAAIVRLHASASLQHGSEYRLTLSCRRGDAVTRQSVQFRYVVPPEERDRPGAQKVVDQPRLPKRFYLCEILFRHEGVLFLGQTIVPRLNPHDFEMAAVGFTEQGIHVSPPNPGYERIQSVTQEVRSLNAPVLKPPLADRTRHFGASADEHGFMVRVSDIGMNVNVRPDEPGDPTFAMWAGVNPFYPNEAVIYRFEPLNGNVERLRRDREHWKRRTEQITKEVLARRDWLMEEPLRRFSIAAFVLQDAAMLKKIRGDLQNWLQAPDEDLDDRSSMAKSRRQMIQHLNVILCLGDPVDLPFLAKLAASKSSGGYLMYFATTISNRYGRADSADVLRPMLQRTELASDPGDLSLLRSLEEGIPQRLRADEVLIDCARLLDRIPSEFGFRSAAARLLELTPPRELTERERVRLETKVKNNSGCWYAPSISARKQAIVMMSKALREIQTP